MASEFVFPACVHASPSGLYPVLVVRVVSFMVSSYQNEEVVPLQRLVVEASRYVITSWRKRGIGLRGSRGWCQRQARLPGRTRPP